MKRILFISILLLLVVASISGCGDQGTVTNKIIVSEFRAISWAPVHLAEQLGYFKKRGLDVEFALYRDGTLALQGMHANNSQFCLVSQGTVFLGEDQGLKSELILAVKHNRPFVLATSKDITCVEQLKDKIVFAGLPGSEPYQLISSVLINAGLDIKKDVSFVNMDYGAALAALGSGQINAAYFGIEYTSELERADVNIVFSTDDPETALKFFGSDKFETDIICVSKNYAQENTKIIQEFVTAVIEAINWMHEHTDDEIAAKIIKYYSSMNTEELAKRISYMRPAYSDNGYITESGFYAVENFFMSYGIPKTRIDYEDIVNMRYNIEANKILSK